MKYLNQVKAGALLRRAQQASLAGRHQAADRLLADCRRLAPQLSGWSIQTALAEARAGQVVAACRTLAEARDAVGTSPAWRLFAGWLEARAGRARQALTLLEPLVTEQPDNRVAACALAYTLLRGGQPDRALSILADGPGDNFEVLSWAWLELERLALAQPLAIEGALPAALSPGPAGPAAARRWAKAAVASWQDYPNCVVRRWLLTRWSTRRGPLRWLIEALERRWPTQVLPALLAVAESGHPVPELSLHLGGRLFEEGYPTAALVWLDRACEEMVNSPEAWLPQLYRAAALVELRRWVEAEQALADLSSGDTAADDASVHEFGEPDWLLRRAQMRLARGELEPARRDLQRAVEAWPPIFDERLRRLCDRLVPVG